MIRFVIILAVLILALSFFGISIRNIVQSPVGHDNFAFIGQLIRTGWHILLGWFHVFVSIVQTVLPGAGK